jgi:hypothetical protein
LNTMTIPTTLPTLHEQLSAVLAAPVPFFFTVLLVWLATIGAISGALWWAFKWRYDGIIEKYKTVLDLALRDAEIVRRRKDELEAGVKSLPEKHGEERASALSTIEQQFAALGQANNAITETLSSAPFHTFGRIGSGRTTALSE